jgi:hypothetical protein
MADACITGRGVIESSATALPMVQIEAIKTANQRCQRLQYSFIGTGLIIAFIFVIKDGFSLQKRLESG